MFTTRCPLTRLSFFCGVFVALWVRAPAAVGANEVDGFTEPSKTVTVAAVETGTLTSVEVDEGDVVEQGQVLARLDDDVHRALLAIAQEGMSAQGQLKSAEAELTMRRQRLEKLQSLRSEGHARQEEVDRAAADLAIADAHLLSATEQQEIKRLEHEKVQVQLERRAIRAPIRGVVSQVYKEVGEFVTPTDPHVFEVVCLDPLMACFNVPSHLAARLTAEQTIPVYLEHADKWVDGQVALISPVTDAESGTVRVKVRVANGEGEYRSGEMCTLQFKSARSTTSRRSASR